MNYNEVVNLIKLIEESKFNTCEINFENTYLNLSKLDTHAFIQPKEVKVANNNDGLEGIKEAVVIKEAEKTTDRVEKEEKEQNENDNIVTSPIVGTFYESSKDGDAPFVKVGDKVKVGDTLCIVEAMKVMNEVKSKFDGKIRKVLLENGDLVEFDQPLFIIETV